MRLNVLLKPLDLPEAGFGDPSLREFDQPPIGQPGLITEGSPVAAAATKLISQGLDRGHGRGI